MMKSYNTQGRRHQKFETRAQKTVAQQKGPMS